MGFDDDINFDDFDEELPDAFREDDELAGLLPEGPEGGGVSRTFKIVGALIVLAVIGIVVVLVYLALQGDKLSPNEKTATAVVAMNATTQKDYENTQTALAVAFDASQTAVRSGELTATAQQQGVETQQAQQTLDAAARATADAATNNTATADAATQQAANAQATTDAINMTATARPQLHGSVVGRDQTAVPGVTIYLFRDNGDGVFNPATDLAAITLTPPAPNGGAATPVPGGEGASPSGGEGAVPASDATPIAYGDTVQGQAVVEQPQDWAFTGFAGDEVSINVAANADAPDLDLFLQLLGPQGDALVEDDDSGDLMNPAILGYKLPSDGVFTIRVSTVSGPGGYTLTLSSTTAPAAPAGNESGAIPAPFVRVVPALVPVEAGGPLRQGAATLTPTVEIPDEFIGSIITGSLGEFDFGSLDPGIYWLVINYSDLPPELQAQVTPTNGQVFIMVTVPVEGDVTFTVGEPPTATPNPDLIRQTETAAAARITGTPGTATVTAAASVTLLAPPSATALPTSGIFSDIGESDGTSGLTILAIAAVGLVAVVFIARKLRTAH